MSKNKQRRTSAYTQGMADLSSGHPVRWTRHPFIKEYRKGYFSKQARAMKGLTEGDKNKKMLQELSILCWYRSLAYTALIAFVVFIILYMAKLYVDGDILWIEKLK